MKEKLVSVIVPCFNAQTTIKKCIESIAVQTYRNIEIVIIDDGSNDDSITICQQLKDTYSFLVFKSIKNSGVSIARNEGIRLASGDYVMFVDSDDYIENDMVKKMVDALQTLNSDMVVCDFYVESEKKVTRFNASSDYYQETFSKYLQPSFFKLVRTNFLNSVCNKIYKKKQIISGFKDNVRCGEDLLFNLCYLKNNHKISYIDYCGYHYCLPKGKHSLSRTYYENEENDFFVIHSFLLSMNRNEKKENSPVDINSFLIENQLGVVKKMFETKLRFHTVMKKIKSLTHNNLFANAIKMHDVKHTLFLYSIIHNNSFLIRFFRSITKVKIICKH